MFLLLDVGEIDSTAAAVHKLTSWLIQAGGYTHLLIGSDRGIYYTKYYGDGWKGVAAADGYTHLLNRDGQRYILY